MAWWEQGFIQGFLAMANHDVHCEPPPFKKEDMKIKMVMQPSPKDEVHPECVLSCEDATHFLTPAFSSGHFVVLLYNLQECTVTVFDGLYMDIKHWEVHIVHTLKYYGIKPLDVKCKATITKASYTRKGRVVGRHGKTQQWMDMSFKSEIDPDQDWPSWTVSYDTDIIQTDGCSCGPIACAKVMEVFGLLAPGSLASIEDYPGGYRAVVMEYYEGLVMKYNKNIYFPVRKQPAKTRLFKESLEGQHKDDVNEVDISSVKSSSSSVIEHVSVQRSVAMDKKNKRQAASAEKEMKRAGQAAIRNGVAPGAVVTLKVDYRTHSHAQGLMGIVFDTKPTGGIKVCCDHGIITHSGGPGVYWVPVDKYVVRATPEEFIPIPDELATVRKLVLDGKFQELGVPTISYAKLHEIMLGATSPVKKRAGCKCKKGKCTKNCGCKRKGVRCHSGCTCNGNCHEQV